MQMGSRVEIDKVYKEINFNYILNACFFKFLCHYILLSY